MTCTDNLRAKKSLGQNFLTSVGALNKIIETADIKTGDTVLEVGPGKGILTKEILSRAGKVIAVEKDDRLIPVLQEIFAKEIANEKLKIVHGDILEFNPVDFGLKKENYLIVANIPYYITGQFLRKFLEDKNHPKKMVLMVQKEVGERIVAKDGKENLLSISVKAFGTPKYIETVKKGSFNPPPKVDSAIISINLEVQPPSKKTERSEEENKKFFEILHVGFEHKRKILAGNLAQKYGNREKIEQVFKKLGFELKIRAENLKLEDWMRLAEELKNG